MGIESTLAFLSSQDNVKAIEPFIQAILQIGAQSILRQNRLQTAKIIHALSARKRKIPKSIITILKADKCKSVRNALDC